MATMTKPVVVKANPPEAKVNPEKNETPPDPGELRHLPLADLIPTPDNVRTIRKDDPKIAELRDSIAKLGVLQPVIARPHPKQPGKFDLRAGARRFVAAGLAGLKTIPVIVRELDDITAGVITITENMDREDLTPMEEARAVSALLGLGFSVQEAAAKLGKAPAFVARRAALSRLAKCWQAAAERGDFRTWPASWWEKIAPLPAETQQRLYTDTSPWIGHRTSSAKELDGHIADYTRELKRAKWPLDDPQLVAKAGACIECQKRSGCHPGLFDIGFDADPKEIKAKDRCLDAECWKFKEAAYVKLRLADAEREYGKVIRVGDTEPDQLTRCKKDAQGALACVDEHGELFWATLKSYAREAAPRRNAGGSPSHVATGDAVMRKSIAEAFATARLAAVMALKGPDAESPLGRGLAACAAHRLLCGPQNHHQGAREARTWLEGCLGLTGVKGGNLTAKALFEKFETVALFDAAAALGYFDQAQPVDGQRGWLPEPGVARRNEAANGFVISEEFLGGHLRVDLNRVAESLGLPANSGATKAGAIKAILDAKLPAGTLTPELAKAFGVKWSKPKPAAPAAKKARASRREP